MPAILQLVQGPDFSQAEWTYMQLLLFTQLASAFAVTAVMKKKFHETNKWAGLLIFLAAFIMAALQTLGIFFTWRLSEIDTPQWKVSMAFNAILFVVPLFCAASYMLYDWAVVVLLLIADGFAWTVMGLVSEIDVAQTVWIFYLFLGIGYAFLFVGAILYAIFGTAPVSSPEYNNNPNRRMTTQQQQYSAINMSAVPEVRYDMPPPRRHYRSQRGRTIRSDIEPES